MRHDDALAARIMQRHHMLHRLARRVASHSDPSNALVELSEAALELTGFGCGQVYVLDGGIWVGHGGAQCSGWEACTVCNTDPRFTSVATEVPMVLRRDAEPGAAILADTPDELAQVLVAPVPIRQDRTCVLVLRSDDAEAEVDGVTLEMVHSLAALAALALETGRAVQAESERRTQLEQQHALQAELLQVLRHDVGSPLATVIGTAEVLAAHGHEMDPAECQDMLRSVADAARRVHRLVDDATEIVARAGIEQPVLPIRPVPLDVAAMVEQTCSAFLTLSATHRIEALVASDVRPVLADPDRLQQVLSNLVGNAVQHTPGGIVRVSASSNGDDHVHIRVTDEGPGIPEEHHEAVFERFGRVEDDVPGTGLGLWIARTLARAMDGDLTLLTGSEGATFELRLPAAPATTAGSTRANVRLV